MRRVVAAALVLAAAAVVSPPAGGQDHEHHAEGYPDVSAATPAQRKKARRLLRATNRNAHRFATMRRARRLGYRAEPRPHERPGIEHMRKHQYAFWGRLLDARRPQALVFWCPGRGRCRLIAFMYRAEWNGRRPTYGGIVSWHNHVPGHTWMTHVFLVRRLAAGYAACVPWNSLEAALGPFYEPYAPGLHVDHPCPDTIHLQEPPP